MSHLNKVVCLLCYWLVTLEVSLCGADFLYKNFNSTVGLKFVGSATVSRCDSIMGHEIAEEDIEEQNGTLPSRISESDGYITATTYDTPNQDDLQQNCSIQIKLTPSFPGKAGAVWYASPLPVLRGFDTMFSFQVTDQSRVCTERRDPHFSPILHTTCSMSGGDGFAFVIHNDPSGIEALGEEGASMGYGGLRSSIAIEFDTHYNTEPGSGDLPYDHIAVHSRGVSEGSVNTWLAEGMISQPVTHPLADGVEHLVRIRYFPGIQAKYFQKFTATNEAKWLLVDNGEARRLGTLVIWIDEGISKDEPLMAVPINLSVALNAASHAIVGFTSATGQSWAKHSVTSWLWCHETDCIDQKNGDWAEFDYHQTSKFSTAKYSIHQPGEGYGEGASIRQEEGLGQGDTLHTSPDTEAWRSPVVHFSNGRTSGIASSSQIPPLTEN
eukprot:405946_1